MRWKAVSSTRSESRGYRAARPRRLRRHRGASWPLPPGVRVTEHPPDLRRRRRYRACETSLPRNGHADGYADLACDAHRADAVGYSKWRRSGRMETSAATPAASCADSVQRRAVEDFAMPVCRPFAGIVPDGSSTSPRPHVRPPGEPGHRTDHTTSPERPAAAVAAARTGLARATRRRIDHCGAEDSHASSHGDTEARRRKEGERVKGWAGTGSGVMAVSLPRLS